MPTHQNRAISALETELHQWTYQHGTVSQLSVQSQTSSPIQFHQHKLTPLESSIHLVKLWFT